MAGAGLLRWWGGGVWGGRGSLKAMKPRHKNNLSQQLATSMLRTSVELVWQITCELRKHSRCCCPQGGQNNPFFIHAHTHMHIHIHIHLHISIHIHIYIHIYMHIYIYISVYVHRYRQRHRPRDRHIHIHIHIHLHIHIHIRAHAAT